MTHTAMTEVLTVQLARDRPTMALKGSFMRPVYDNDICVKSILSSAMMVCFLVMLQTKGKPVENIGILRKGQNINI